MRISDWSSDVCSSDLGHARGDAGGDVYGALVARPADETAQQTRRCQSAATLGLDEQAEVVGNQVVAAPVRRAGADHSTDEHALPLGDGTESPVLRQAPVPAAAALPPAPPPHPQPTPPTPPP